MAKRGESPKGGKVWVLTFRYQDMEIAGHGYAKARDIVFAEDIDATDCLPLIRVWPAL